MRERPEETKTKLEAARQFQFMQRILNSRSKTGLRNPNVWIIAGITLVFAFIYYRVLTAYHDVYIILFFYPMLYAAVVYRLRGVVITGTAFLVIVLPQAVLLSQDPYSVVRTLLFAAFAFLISSLGATLLNYLERQLDAYREIVSLNEELNTYIERLENAQRQLIQSEKMNALGQLSASVAHEINNPLAGILVYSKLLAKKANSGTATREELITDLAKIETAVTHVSRIVRSLLDFARQTEPVLKSVTVSEIIDNVITIVGHRAETGRVQLIRNELSPSPVVMVDSGQIQQVFVNLMVNAIQAMPAGGKLEITVFRAEKGLIRVGFSDNGVGIPKENLDKLFTPFFSTRPEGEGTGLGLSVSYGIIERNGGKIEVQSEVDKGSTFTVSLPEAK